jgi:hypothetical protein
LPPLSYQELQYILSILTSPARTNPVVHATSFFALQVSFLIPSSSLSVGITGSGVLIAIKCGVNSFCVFRDVFLARKIEELQVL